MSRFFHLLGSNAGELAVRDFAPGGKAANLLVALGHFAVKTGIETIESRKALGLKANRLLRGGIGWLSIVKVEKNPVQGL